MKTGEFRLSPKKKLNDHGQMTAYLQRAHNLAVERFGEDAVGEGFLQYLIQSLPDSYYIGCFTESLYNREMWATYAKDDGVCLSFYPEELRANHVGGEFTFHLMHYPSQREWDAKVIKFFEQIAPLVGIDEVADEFKRGLSSIFIECIVSKHGLFSYEKETRLIFGDTMHSKSNLIEIRDDYAYLKLPPSCLTRVFTSTFNSMEADKFI